MDKKSAFEALEARAASARISLHQLCKRTKIAPSTISRWRARPDMMSWGKLGELEAEIGVIERERAAAAAA